MTQAASELQPEEIIHPYIDASGQVAFEVLRHIYDKHTGFVQHRRPSGDPDQSWVWSLEAGEFMRPAPGEDWEHFDSVRYDRYPATRERRFFANAPAIPYRLRELREAIAAGRTIYVVPDEGAVDFCYDKGECATCCANEWRRLHSIFLQGAADVVLMLSSKNTAREIARSLIPRRNFKQPPAPMIVRRLSG